MRNEMIVLMKTPMFTVTAPACLAAASDVYGAAAVAPSFKTINKLEKSTFPKRRPMGGMMTSVTSEVMMVPKAAPMMIPTAMSNTFPRKINF